MELMLVVTTLYILSLLVISKASHQTHDHEMLSSLEQVYDLGISLTELPRKLRPVEEPSIVKRYKTEDSKPEANKKEDLPGKIHSQMMLNGREGTRHRWIQRKDRWQFFTMDYSQVRRRRPINNKVMPTS
ncbi:hypothetical protein NE237_005780 [Protea cynaroides]|uniref:Uncharacterized protein n=1 Tax=Protea cynaroides TaxID=273540 RepID=A0A9Q0KLV7_9MAGN|nr:hypothetical protein NE237_005780 [Protea cynaroides]